MIYPTKTILTNNFDVSFEYLRLITMLSGDVKRKGAYKNSRYYSLYGNPNAPFLNQNKYVELYIVLHLLVYIKIFVLATF